MNQISRRTFLPLASIAYKGQRNVPIPRQYLHCLVSLRPAVIIIQIIMNQFAFYSPKL